MPDSALTAALSIALAVSILRVYSLLRSLGWLLANYEGFNRLQDAAIRRRTQQRAGISEQIYDATNGGFFPFGVRSYKLKRWTRGASPVSRLVRSPLRLIRHLWRWWTFAGLLFPIALVILSIYPVDLTDTQQGLVFAVILTVSIGTISIAAESCLAYFLLDSWVSYHYFGDIGNVTRKRAISEISIFAGAFITAYSGAIGMITYTAVRHNAFDKIPTVSSLAGPDELLAKLPAILFTAFSNLAFGSAGDPNNAIGNAISLILLAHCISYVLIGIALVIAVRHDSLRARRRRPA